MSVLVTAESTSLHLSLLRAVPRLLPAMRRVAGRIMSAAVIAGAATFAVAGPAAVATPAAAAVAAPATAGQLAARHRAVPAINQRIAAYALTFAGRYPYRWGGTSPRTGFDCSGLAWYVYRHFGLALPRTAQQQSAAVRRVSWADAMPGDLVFFHDSTGYVYHVGIYQGAGTLVAAADPAEGIVDEIIWTSAVTFGTLTH